MSPASPRALRFVRALAAGARATAQGDEFVAKLAEGRGATLDRATVHRLWGDGVLVVQCGLAVAAPGARSWLRRAQCESDGAAAAQHRVLAPGPDGSVLNLAESPLARLAAPGPDGTAFLEPHQVEAGERIRRLTERAQLRSRVTMSYDPARTAGGGNGIAMDVGDMALDARRQLAEAIAALPRDCAGVVLDVCGLLKGLQTVEAERSWPRRSAKLVLRIGLEQLAQHFGLAAVAEGQATGRRRSWMDDGARPTVLD